MIRREPLGIVAGICPWNYPLFMAVWKMGPALAAGNVQIIKPAEQTPLTMLRFVELAQEVLPPGVLQVVTGDGVPVGDALVRHPAISLVSLTGDIGDGKADREERRRHRQARPPRARRQGADGRARRRRPGDRGRGDQDRRLLQLGPGLHGLVARPRQRAHLRRCPREHRRRGRGAHGRRPRRTTTRSGWGPSSRRPAASACSASSSAPSTRRPRCSPAARRPATAATSSSPRS